MDDKMLIGNSSRSHYYRHSEEEDCRSKRLKFTDNEKEQDNGYIQSYNGGKHHQQISFSSKSSDRGAGNWDLACALAYLHLFGDFVAKNEPTDCSSSSSSLSSHSSVNSVNYKQTQDDDTLNFVLYVLTGTTTPAQCFSKAESAQKLAVPDVVNPNQAAHHWFSASRSVISNTQYQ